MLMSRYGALLAASLVAVGDAQNGIWSVGMYRALEKQGNGKEAFKLSNNNLGDIVGVLRYILQEVIPEHTQANHSRAARKNGIDAVALYKMQVKNVGSITSVQAIQPIVGFGPYGAFDYGISSDPNMLQVTVNQGDFVGASVEDSPQIKYTRSWYWYSVDGPCPNLPWKCIPPFPGCPGAVPDIVPVYCQGTGCAGKNDPAAQKCPKDPTFHKVDPADPKNAQELRQCCLRYASDTSTVIKGGLCDAKTPVPAGIPGCVYQYEDLTSDSYVMLDDIVGLKSMTCKGGQKCKNWLDFRENCDDPSYKRQFACSDCVEGGGWTVSIVTTSYCVEYDIHPYCQSSAKLCDDPRCQKLLSDGDMPKELGVDFWKGKCDPIANTQRAEAFVDLAHKGATKGMHTLVNSSFIKDNPQCASADPTKPNSCTPNQDGGPYCTRTFAGICSICYIPNTSPPYPIANTPMCPLNISQESGLTIHAGTVCKSKKPSDWCCLYGVTECDGTKISDLDPDTAPFDEDTYALFVAKANTTAMAQWAQRWVKAQGGKLQDKEAFHDLVYWSWSPHPYPELQLTVMQEKLKESTAIAWPNNPTPGPDGPNGPSPGGGLGAGVIVAIVAGVLVVLGLGGFGLVRFRKKQRDDAHARNMALLGQQGGAPQQRV